MQNQTPEKTDAQRASLAALDQAYEYRSGDVLKPSAKDFYEEICLAA